MTLPVVKVVVAVENGVVARLPAVGNIWHESDCAMMWEELAMR